MAVTVKAWGTPTSLNSNTGSAVSIATPTAANGDVLVAFITDQNSSVTGYSCAGWTRVGPAFTDSSNAQRTTQIFIKVVADAKALATQYTFTRPTGTGGRTGAVMVSLKGVDNANPIAGNSAYAASTTVAPTLAVPAYASAGKFTVRIANSQWTAGNNGKGATTTSGLPLLQELQVMPASDTTVSRTMLHIWGSSPSTIPADTITTPGSHSQMAAFYVSFNEGVYQATHTKAVHFYVDGAESGPYVFSQWDGTQEVKLEVDTIMPYGFPSVAAMLATPNFMVAHRGGSINWAEMSMRAYTQCVLKGYGALEISVARSSDGVWFGLHDNTLDRTSGTTNGVPRNMTWAQIQAYQITSVPAQADPAFGPQPYMRLVDLLDTYAKSHVLFIDGKYETAYAADLLAVLDAWSLANGHDLKQSVVSKGFGVSPPSNIAQILRNAGYKGWGYFYEEDVPNLPAYAGTWDILGMDFRATTASWNAALSYGKPVMGHVIPDQATIDLCKSLGAAGFMVSGVNLINPRQ